MHSTVITISSWRLILLSYHKFPIAKQFIIQPIDEYNSEKPEYIHLPDGMYIQVVSWMDEFPEYVECFSILKNPSDLEVQLASKFKVAEVIGDLL